MARSRAKAKSNKKPKKQEDSERDGLDANEYFVGTSPDAAPCLNASRRSTAFQRGSSKQRSTSSRRQRSTG